MTIGDIKALIAVDESRTLELKKSTGELKDGMHAACAFLNAEGVWPNFGVTPQSHKIVGQPVTDVSSGSGSRHIIEVCREYRWLAPKHTTR